MTRPPPLPDLATLSDTQKDELITSLWQTIAAPEAAPAAPAPQAPAGDLRERIARAEPSRRAWRQSRAGGKPGLWRGLLASKIVMGVFVALVIGFGADRAIGWYQNHALGLRRQVALELENAAFAGLTIELTNVAYAPDRKSYRATVTLQNSNPDSPLYIMLSPARVFVQTGLIWQGVSTQAAPGTRWGVVKLESAQEIGVDFQVDGVSNWAELMPGYMHVRIESSMLISRSSEPKEDLVDRANRFYIYLKPPNADDAAIKKRLNFPGAPPLYMPMPPH